MSAHLDNTYGAAFIGMVVASVLYGVSCVQALYYFTNHNDSWRIQLPVAAVLIFDTVHQALITHSVYTYTITDWGNPEQLQFVVWSILVEIIFTGITAFIVQSFLTMRIWRLSSQNMYLTSISAILTTSGIVSVIAYCSKAFKIKTLLGLATNLKGESIAVNVVGAATDIFIAISLCTLLNVSRTGFHRSDAIINKLILFSVNTGLLTSLCALASMISILAAGDTFIYISFFFCLGRLYTNSLLATLNARKMLRGIGSQSRSTDTTSLSLRDFPNKSSISQRQNISLKLDTTTQEYLPGNPRKLHEEVSRSPNAAVLSHGNEYNEEENSEGGHAKPGMYP